MNIEIRIPPSPTYVGYGRWDFPPSGRLQVSSLVEAAEVVAVLLGWHKRPSVTVDGVQVDLDTMRAVREALDRWVPPDTIRALDQLTEWMAEGREAYARAYLSARLAAPLHTLPAGGYGDGVAFVCGRIGRKYSKQRLRAGRVADVDVWAAALMMDPEPEPSEDDRRRAIREHAVGTLLTGRRWRR